MKAIMGLLRPPGFCAVIPGRIEAAARRLFRSKSLQKADPLPAG